MAIASSVPFNCHQGEEEERSERRRLPAACEYCSLSIQLRADPCAQLLDVHVPGARMEVCSGSGCVNSLSIREKGTLLAAMTEHPVYTGGRAALRTFWGIR
jgi:hypothetical protein